MTLSMYGMVREFLQVFGTEPLPQIATAMSWEAQALWDRLDEEETREFHEARASGDLVHTAHELCDRIYILFGHAARLGFTRFDEMFAEVHRANMSKLGADGKPVIRADGKVLKGPNYKPPQLAPFIDVTSNAAERWDRHFLDLALTHARMSKDPSTKVGAVIVGPDREIISAGFNGLPRGIADSAERLNDRNTKLRLVVHGEINAIMAAARIGTPVKRCTMYVAATDASGAIWGGPPCVRCTVETIQAGIAEIVSWPMKTAPSRWRADLEEARKLLIEAGIVYREVSL